eukprot:1182130-Pyramimonas_sp.AAC.1
MSNSGVKAQVLRVTMPDLLSEAAFAGNSLNSCGCAIPFQVWVGWQPVMPPDMSALPDDAAGAARAPRRLRELALQRI